ncbi:threonine--tRNA ligase [Buchnera aphidicola]|uniref:Threonine--tRNA ligase n=1 Tax=Buchnera aphidicola (Sarucallis kahawaluokalani) TaxID=1241878 RepID=A0A4D6YJ45_9GAMM|nr:threonine--tRNA ligase [Buchnera aphidicola]QCI25890.1 threonine--tRNA ligase [Buchnera aphidicola (Sarucallis kahawaluokalani)]
MPVITLLNGKKKIYKNIVSLVKVAEDIKKGFSKIIFGAMINGKIVDIHYFIETDVCIQFLTVKDIQSNILFAYSCLQMLAYSCKKIWKTSKIGIGNVIKNKFYCDIDINRQLNEQDIVMLEEYMNKLINKKYNILFKNLSFFDVKKILTLQNESYKLYYLKKKFLLNQLIPVYLHENYLDLYFGPQLPNVKYCLYFKLQRCIIIYRNYEISNKNFQRIHGTVWLNQQEMLYDLNRSQMIYKRDHRKINRVMKLYHKQKEAPGMIFWHPHGWIIFNELKHFISSQLKKWKYQEINTPLMLNKSLWKISGHLKNFSNSIFFTRSENNKYCIKPMNCPAHIQIFNRYLRSYRELPIRFAEFGVCHRDEKSGALYGLLRLKSFTQDDAHIFCTPEQVKTEISNCIKMIMESYKIFGFKNIYIKFSTRPKKRIGDDAIWDKAECSLQSALIDAGLKFEYQKGEGAFYGPKIEFILEDCLHRLWQCGTIQLDFYLPERFGSYYIDESNHHQTPVMIHRAILGSMERFIGILLEEYSGLLPIWLSPIQVVILNINDQHNEYVINIYKKLFKENIRVQYDIKNEKINFKIRKYIVEKIPYILICGDKEIDCNQVSVRNRDNITKVMHIDNFIKTIKYEIDSRVL